MHRRTLAIADQLMHNIEAIGRSTSAVLQLTCLKQWQGRSEAPCPTRVTLVDLLRPDDRGIHTEDHAFPAARSLTPSLGQQQCQYEQQYQLQVLTGCSQRALLSHCGITRAIPLHQQQRWYSSGIAPAALQRLAGIKARHDELCRQLSGEPCSSERQSSEVKQRSVAWHAAY